MLMIEGSGSGKKNSLFNLKIQQPDIDKVIYMLKIYAKQNVNFELVNGKVQAQSILMI